MSNPTSLSYQNENSIHQPTRKKEQYFLVIIAILALVTDAMTVRSLNMLAPFIRSELGIDKSQFGYTVSIFMFGSLLTTLPAGILIDRLNIRKAFIAIFAALCMALFWLSRQDSFYEFMGVLFFIGLLRTGIAPLVNRVIIEKFDPKKRGAVMGFIYAASPLGGFIGAVILPIIAQNFNWNTGYLFLSILALLGALITWKKMPNNWHQPVRIGLKFHPLASLSPIMLILCMTYALHAFGGTSDSFITLYLVDNVKTSAMIAGIFYSMIQLTGIGGRVFWGMLADRYFSHNRWWLLAAIDWLSVIAFSFLIRLNAQSSMWMTASIMVLIGLSCASSWGVLCTLIGDVVEIESIAIATSTVFFTTNLAEAFGPSVFGNIVQHTNSYQFTWNIYIGIIALSASIFTVMAYKNKSQSSDQVSGISYQE
jgi:predicted MFS family arabinose efflux permease